jgi:ADP-dependent NAD(P)H-hydrate dehydratase
LSPRARPSERPRTLTPALLRRLALPRPAAAGDKEHRGRVLIVGGAPSMPGAVILAATAALRAGAGKLQIAAPASIATAVGVAVPEALVVALPETREGAIAPSAAATLVARANDVQALLVGPGLVGGEAVARLLARVLPRVDGPAVVLDAEAFWFLSAHHDGLRALRPEAILTPHAGEMATLLGVPKDEVNGAQAEVALRAARAFGAVVALKGAETYIAAPAPGAPLFRNRTGNVGLATSGSGDTLSGVVAGLAARGASPQQAAAWAVYLHGSAGDRLARRIGDLGFLARELLDEIPVVMQRLSGPPR